MSDQNDLQSRVHEMARLGILANRIGEIQEKNLRMYPFVFFNEVKSVKIDYDLSKVDDNGQINKDVEHHVTYILEADKESNFSLPKRFEAIENATRNIFWKDLKVKVVLNGTLEFESK